MTPDDETELERLSDMLRGIDASLPADAPQREVVVKAGLALIQTFTAGGRPALEELFATLNTPLSDEQLAHLRKLRLIP